MLRPRERDAEVRLRGALRRANAWRDDLDACDAYAARTSVRGGAGPAVNV